MAFVVTAKWTAKDGHEDDVRNAILRLIEPSRKEPGNLCYRANRHPEDRRVFFLYEEYVDAAAYQSHGSSEHFQTYGHGKAIPLLESRERVFYETLD